MKRARRGSSEKSANGRERTLKRARTGGTEESAKKKGQRAARGERHVRWDSQVALATDPDDCSNWKHCLILAASNLSVLTTG